MVVYMIEKRILPDPNHINVDEHCNICTSGRKKYYSHPIYQQYSAQVGANLFQSGIRREIVLHVWRTTPLELKLLVAKGNKGKRY
jgi:hypothetical protein